MPAYGRWPDATRTNNTTMSMEPIGPEQIREHLDRLNTGDSGQWRIENGRLYRCFVFRDFIEAIGFMTRAAMVAEKMNHHPEWRNVYKTVHVHLITHSCDGITELDFKLAEQMNGLSCLTGV